jgi:rhodanese-related sulfurtransferase
MWKFLQRFRRDRAENANHGNDCESRTIRLISVAELASFFTRAPDSLIVFDLRDYNEIEAYPSAIRGALLTCNVNLDALVPWIPPETIVVLYGAADIPPRQALFHLVSKGLRFVALEGGLRSWQEAGLPMEQLLLADRRPVDKG